MMMMMEERSKMGQPAPHTSRARQGQQRPVETLLHTQRCGGNKKKMKRKCSAHGHHSVLRRGVERCQVSKFWCARPVRSGASQHQHQKHTRTPLDISVGAGGVRGEGTWLRWSYYGQSQKLVYVEESRNGAAGSRELL